MVVALAALLFGIYSRRWRQRAFIAFLLAIGAAVVTINFGDEKPTAASQPSSVIAEKTSSSPPEITTDPVKADPSATAQPLAPATAPAEPAAPTAEPAPEPETPPQQASVLDLRMDGRGRIGEEVIVRGYVFLVAGKPIIYDHQDDVEGVELIIEDAPEETRRYIRGVCNQMSRTCRMKLKATIEEAEDEDPPIKLRLEPQQ